MFNFLSKAQIVKEWYFFNGYNSSLNISNITGVTSIVSHDSLIFGYINESSNNNPFYAYKATHRQGLIKKAKFNYALSTNYAVDMCIDTTHKFIYYLTQTGIRPPLNKYSQGMVYKLDYDLNTLDSTVISFGTIFNSAKILCKNNKVYVLGGANNFFSEPIRLVAGVLDATNLSVLNIQNVTGNDNSRIPFNAYFDCNNNIRIFLRQAGSNTGPLNYNQFIVDTNLVKVDSLCTFGLCYFGATSIVKDDHSFTFNTGFDPYKYNIYPYSNIHSYVVKVKENGDTIKSTSFLNNNANQLSYYSMFSLFKTKNNSYLASGIEYINGNFSNPLKFIYFNLDSNLNIVSKFKITDFISKHPGGGLA